MNTSITSITSTTSTTSGSGLRRHLAAAVLAGATVATSLALGAPAVEAAATPTTTILVVHGFDGGGLGDLPLDSAVDCRNSTMTAWVNGLRARGFTDVRTVGYYQGDRNCDINLAAAAHADNTINTSIDQIAREFADMVAVNFTSQNTNVAISAHSMGGMIVRRALHGVQNGHASFPTQLLVSDVVTSGSPHNGASVALVCGILPPGFVPQQCSQLATGSAFLGALGHNPQATGGTDWTVIGSDCDLVVSGASAVALNRVSVNRPTVFRRQFAAPGLFSGGCLGAAGFDHSELVTLAAPLDVIRNGLLTNN